MGRFHPIRMFHQIPVGSAESRSIPCPSTIEASSGVAESRQAQMGHTGGVLRLSLRGTFARPKGSRRPVHVARRFALPDQVLMRRDRPDVFYDTKRRLSASGSCPKTSSLRVNKLGI